MGKLLTEAERDLAHERLNLKPRTPRRVLALGGGGPAVGISLGFLLALEEWNQRKRDEGRQERAIEFPVWVAGCVGGWLACLYHLCKEPRASQVEVLIRQFFRENDMYANFPCPTTFTPDIPDQIAAGLKFLVDPTSYTDLVVPGQIAKGYWDILNFYLSPSKWNQGDLCFLLLNSVFAPNPAARLLMSLLYKSNVPGINTIWFGPEYSLLKPFDDLKGLRKASLPDIYINSYNIDKHRSDIYCNHPKKSPVTTKPITMPALCASSALPYVLSPVKVDDEIHIEGALVDSFCFEAVHSLHDDINEVWISRIVDHKQVQAPTNLLEALNNLIMLYAGTTSRHDIEVFVNEINLHELFLARHVKPNHVAKPIEIFQLPVDPDTRYLWSYENLDNSISNSKANCLKFIEDYDTGVSERGARLPARKNLFVRTSQFD